MPDGNLRKVLRTIRQCVTRITGGGGLHSRLNQVQASLDTAQSRLRSSGIYSPPIQTALDHAKHAAFSLDAYTQTEHAWEQAIGAWSSTAAPESSSSTQTIDSGARGGTINSGNAVAALADVNSQAENSDVIEARSLNQETLGTSDAGELNDLFAEHTALRTAWRASEARFAEIAAQYGIEVKSFSGSNLQKIIERLEAKGVGGHTLEELDDLADSIYKGGTHARMVAEQVGERGGMHRLEVEGYHTPEAFHTPQGLKGPGPYRVDGFAMSRNGNELVIPEYKGGQSKYNPNKTYTLRQLDPSRSAPQGTPDYVMDRMLSDERVVQYLHDHPDLWHSIKNGRTSLRTDVYETPIYGKTTRVHSVSFCPWSDFITKMEDNIAHLR